MTTITRGISSVLYRLGRDTTSFCYPGLPVVLACLHEQYGGTSSSVRLHWP